MTTKHQTTGSENKGDKKMYLKPEISCIELDNEISLALESDPLPGPGETNLFKSPESFTKDPYGLS